MSQDRGKKDIQDYHFTQAGKICMPCLHSIQCKQESFVLAIEIFVFYLQLSLRLLNQNVV